MKKALIAAIAALLPAWTAAAHAGAIVDLAVVNRFRFTPDPRG